MAVLSLDCYRPGMFRSWLRCSLGRPNASGIGRSLAGQRHPPWLAGFETTAGMGWVSGVRVYCELAGAPGISLPARPLPNIFSSEFRRSAGRSAAGLARAWPQGRAYKLGMSLEVSGLRNSVCTVLFRVYRGAPALAMRRPGWSAGLVELVSGRCPRDRDHGTAGSGDPSFRAGTALQSEPSDRICWIDFSSGVCFGSRV